MKSLKNISTVGSLWFVVGFLAGAALATTTESQTGLETGAHGATLALTATKTQISSRNCLGSDCPTNAFVTLSRLDGSPVFSGIHNVGASGGTLTLSKINTLDVSPTGSTSLEHGVDRAAKIPPSLAFSVETVNRRPELHLTAATITGRLDSPYLQSSGTGIGSMVRGLFCSSPAREDCISESLFNSNPTIKSGPTGKVTLAPEPTAAFLLGTGLLALGLIRRRQKTDRT